MILRETTYKETTGQLIETRIKFLQHIFCHKSITKFLRPNTLLIPNIDINVSYTYIGGGASPNCSGDKAGLILGTMPFQCRANHTHPHSDWDSGDMPVHLMWTSLECGRKLESSKKKTHVDMGEHINSTQWPS